MHRTILLVPVGSRAGLTAVLLGLSNLLTTLQVRVQFWKPVIEGSTVEEPVHDTRHLLRPYVSVISDDVVPAIPASQSPRKFESFLEKILETMSSRLEENDVLLVEGLKTSADCPEAMRINGAIFQTLTHAEAWGVLATPSSSKAAIDQLVRVQQQSLNLLKWSALIFNRIYAPNLGGGTADMGLAELCQAESRASLTDLDLSSLKSLEGLPVIGKIPWIRLVQALRTCDLVSNFSVQVLSAGESCQRRVHSLVFCSRGIEGVIPYLKDGAFLIAGYDRVDVLCAATLAEANHIKLAGLLFTGGLLQHEIHLSLCQSAFKTGLPIYHTLLSTWEIALEIQRANTRLSARDSDRVDSTAAYVAQALDRGWLSKWVQSPKTETKPLSLGSIPFRYRLITAAQQLSKRILLPEGTEPRILQAAVECAKRRIATPVLFGQEEEIVSVAKAYALTLPDHLEIIEPRSLENQYVDRLYALRAAKGLTRNAAKQAIQDPLILATLLLETGFVDGMVAGAAHTTAATIRPAIQLLKRPGSSSLISSVFFMLLPEQVLVFADCAINPDPSAEALAEIAIQSARSAQALGIEPRVAMISYSTGYSGSGQSVEKVHLATRLAQEKAPDLLIEGPLQYDAAIVPSVAEKKAPESRIAGRATVFVFPDLNTGNTVYKAVQRTGEVLSIGPVLQGLLKPVNDLSRGVIVEDIVYTIAITAIQAEWSLAEYTSII